MKPPMNASLPLSRYTVLDLTRARSGPTAVRQLGDWGANVIKIEPTGDQDDYSSPFDKRHGPDFQNLHRNKRSITLDLKAPDGLAVFKRLADKADVIVENFRPGVKHRLGIDYESLRKTNRRLVYASISGFGQEGPYKDRPGLDQVVQGMGGLMSVTGLPGQGRCAPASRSRTAPPALLRIRHRAGAARARAYGRRAVGADLAAAGLDRAHRFPGRALAGQP